METARLTLRQPLRRDATALLHVTQDASIIAYYGASPFQNRTEAAGEIARFKELFAHDAGIHWVIAREKAGPYIGDIGLHQQARKPAQARIEFRLAPALWHQGLMMEALAAVLRYGFTVMPVQQIEATLSPPNTWCIGVLKRAGFTEERHLRDQPRQAAGVVNAVALSLLRTAYARPDGKSG